MCGFIAFCPVPGVRRLPGGPTQSAAKYNGRLKRTILEGKLMDALRAMEHRGPDEPPTTWMNGDASVGLGHCRMATNDLAAVGLQPLKHASEPIHAVVIGEIYEYDVQRSYCESKGYAFRSRCDSELVLALYSVDGAPGMFSRLRGEFAFVIVDGRKETRVIAARDRFGVKPICWTHHDGKLLFAAEAKAFLPMGWRADWDVESITTSTWLSGESTMFKGVWDVAPGYWMEVTPEKGVRFEQYWDQQYPEKRIVESRGLDEMMAGVRHELIEAVRIRLRADVKMGLYLSGGIDSSTVAGIVEHLIRVEGARAGNPDSSDNRIKCFTVKFPDAMYDESEIAKRTAESLGFDLEMLDINEQMLADNFEDAVFAAERPFFDLNSVSKFILSSLLARDGIKVVLSGEGSDEHFAGYSYFYADFLCAADESMPNSTLAQDANASLRQDLYKQTISEINSIVDTIGLGLEPTRGWGGMTMSAVRSLVPNPGSGIFEEWTWDRSISPRLACSEMALAKLSTKMKGWHPLHAGLYIWTKTVLPNVILRGMGESSSMAHGIEDRPPFLDHKLATYVNSLPPSVKMHYNPADTQGSSPDNASNYWWKNPALNPRPIEEKHILHEVGREFVTDEVYRRPKLMFMAPVQWARDGPLETKFRNILTEAEVKRLGFVNWPRIKDALDRGFGACADPSCFRDVLFAASWVTLSQRFDVRTAMVEEDMDGGAFLSV